MNFPKGVSGEFPLPSRDEVSLSHKQPAERSVIPVASNRLPTRRNQPRASKHVHGRPANSPETSIQAKWQQDTTNITYFDPQINGYEPLLSDTCREDTTEFISSAEIPPEIWSEVATTVNSIIPEPHTSYLLTPTSRISLYRNLLFLINDRKPPASLPALIDYLHQYPKLQSTRCYNLLIDLSIRHRFYGITTQLFRSLRQHSLPQNIDTYKLHVRYLVQQALWNEAWTYVRHLQIERRLPRDQDGRDEIPLPIWLEFCRVPKKRGSSSQKNAQISSSQEHLDTVTFVHQHRILSETKPTRMPQLSDTPPYAVYCLVQLMLKSGKQSEAMELTKAYFKAIPRAMDTRKMLTCLRIIHIHLASCTAKQGLPRFTKARRTLITLLRLHPSLHPTSRTVALLFKILERAKRCGTVAWHHLAKFKRDFGGHLQDRRVLRHVCRLALKEGRMDIVKKTRRLNSAAFRYRQRRLLEASFTKSVKWIPKAKHVRNPLRKVCTMDGRESQLWTGLRAKIRQKLLLWTRRPVYGRTRTLRSSKR